MLSFFSGDDGTLGRYNERRQHDSAALHPDDTQIRRYDIDEEFPLDAADLADLEVETDEDTLIDDE